MLMAIQKIRHPRYTSREYGFSMNKNVSQGNLEIQVPPKDGVNVPASF